MSSVWTDLFFTWAGPTNHTARYLYLNCIDGIEQQTNKISVKWINSFKQWVWVGQVLPKSIIVGMFKSEGLEEFSKFGCLTTSALIYLRSESVLPMWLEPWLSYILMANVAHFVFITHHSKDHNFYTWAWHDTI